MELGNVIDSASDAAARSGAITPANSEIATQHAPAPVVDANTPRSRIARVGGADLDAPQPPPPPPPPPQGSGRGQVVDILV